MILYHFTALSLLDQIKAEGLSKGEIPLTARRTTNAVWFTTDSEAAGHGLSDGETLSRDHIQILKAKGFIAASAPDEGLKWLDKRAVRIKVVIPSTDHDLKRWVPWGRKHLEREWFDTLSKVGGGHQKARTWYVCFRTVQPAEFAAIDILRCETA
ncbi:hypothetical protein [Mesorhizobium sp. M0088]|uniref:hypothetical protein n=1 Tax=Mesorhizobium sp. M0088 TaxID=2956873 RepID=UPI00333DB62B